MCEPDRHADLWLTSADIALGDLAGILARAGVPANDLREATAEEAELLGLNGRLWLSFSTASVRHR